MNIYELERVVAAIPDSGRTQEQVEMIMSLDMHKTDNFMRALEALKADQDMTYSEWLGSQQKRAALIAELEEVKP